MVIGNCGQPCVDVGNRRDYSIRVPPWERFSVLHFSLSIPYKGAAIGKDC